MGTWFRGFDRAPIFNGWLLHFRKQQTAYEGNYILDVGANMQDESQGQAGDLTVEVTECMASAGLRVLYASGLTDHRVPADTLVVAEIFRAMLDASGASRGRKTD